MNFKILGLLAALTVSAYGACPTCGQEPTFRNLPYPACLPQVELVVENSNAYGPQDLRRILPFINQANREFYRCGRYEIAVGKEITVIVDTEKGTVYLTRFIFRPEE